MSYRRINSDDRIRIEMLFNEGYSYREIARRVGFSPSAIHAEVKRGLYDHLDGQTWKIFRRYSAVIAREKSLAAATAKGPMIKLGKRYDYAAHVSQQIHAGQSPDAITGRLRREGNWTVCTTTLYAYIDRGYIPGVTNQNLLEKTRRKRKYKKTKKTPIPAKYPAGDSIAQRPTQIGDRQEFGHWEMDTVIGKSKGKKQALLVLTERKTRMEIISHLPDKTTKSAVTAFRRILSVHPRGTFKTVTVDNGSEFSNCYGFEHDQNRKRKTKLYYCHPYSSYERGSNENANKIIRRFFPKGQTLEFCTSKQVKQAMQFQNNLPRKILGYATPAELFAQHTDALRKNF